MLRVHRELTERIRSVRRLDFTLQDRIQAAYVEHARILRAVLGRQADVVKELLTLHIQASQLQVRNITLHQLQQARRSWLIQRVLAAQNLCARLKIKASFGAFACNLNEFNF
jgi:uncharacterized protein with PIN domain